MAQVKLGDVAVECRETYKGDKTGMPIVGLEHITPEEVTLSNWDTDTENTFTKQFRKGDMLFGRRRAYLKKAAQAPFDGICSGDITVIRAKEDLLLPELLPFIIQNDRLFEFAVGKSAGSLSPRVKWENLKNYTFDLPPIEEQGKLAEVLWSINDTLQAYQNLLAQTDALMQAQFVEMFGDPQFNPRNNNISKLSEISIIMSGITKGRKTKAALLTSVPYICTANVQNGYIDWSETKYIEATQDEIEKYSLFSDDVLIIEGGDPDKVGRGCLAGVVPEKCIYQNHVFRVRVNKELIYPEFFAKYILLPYTKSYFLSCAKQTTGIATINKKQLSNLMVMYPPLEEQSTYLQFAKQNEQARSTLQNTITSLQATKRSILERALGTGRKE